LAFGGQRQLNKSKPTRPAERDCGLSRRAGRHGASGRAKGGQGRSLMCGGVPGRGLAALRANGTSVRSHRTGQGKPQRRASGLGRPRLAVGQPTRRACPCCRLDRDGLFRPDLWPSVQWFTPIVQRFGDGMRELRSEHESRVDGWFLTAVARPRYHRSRQPPVRRQGRRSTAS